MNNKKNKWTIEKIRKLTRKDIESLSEEDKKVINKILDKKLEEGFKEWGKTIEKSRKEWEEEERREKEMIEKNPELKRKYEEMERKKRERERKIKELEKKLSKEDREIRNIMLDIISDKRSLIFTTVPVNRRGELLNKSDEDYLTMMRNRIIESLKILEDKYKLKGMRKMDKKAREVLIYDKKRAKLAEEGDLELFEVTYLDNLKNLKNYVKEAGIILIK